MTQDTIEPTNVEETGKVQGLWGRFREIERLRVVRDEDGSPIAYSNRERWGRDHLYPHSSKLLGIYIERSTKSGFSGALGVIRKRVRVVSEQIGDLDGILLFPWGDIQKLPWFFKSRSGNINNIRKGKE